jgi:hypothetical protein
LLPRNDWLLRSWSKEHLDREFHVDPEKLKVGLEELEMEQLAVGGVGREEEQVSIHCQVLYFLFVFCLIPLSVSECQHR